jgi:L-amino acid N-acyltransferase YncA
MRIELRDSKANDSEAIAQIYGHYVSDTLISMEEAAPSASEILRRREHVLSCKLPYLVALVDDEVIGYCYALPYRPRSAWRYTIEHSIYLKQDAGQKGIGRMLLTTLLARCRADGYLQMIAMIAGSDNFASIHFHEKMGFRMAGTLFGVGIKFGKLVDSVIMQRDI